METLVNSLQEVSAQNRLGRLRHFWQASSLIVWNTIVLFIASNLLLAGIYHFVDAYRLKKLVNPILYKYGPNVMSQLLKLYPSLSEQ